MSGKTPHPIRQGNRNIISYYSEADERRRPVISDYRGPKYPKLIPVTNVSYFSHKDIEYFSNLAHFTPNRPDPTSDKIQTALRTVLHTYASDPISRNWRNGVVSYEEELGFKAISEQTYQ